MTASEIADLEAGWATVEVTCAMYRGNLAARVDVTQSDVAELLTALRTGADHACLEADVLSWAHERAEARMQALTEQIQQVAETLGKGPIAVVAAPTRLRLPEPDWAGFWSVFGHVVRNAVDHGLEGVAARRAVGKSDHGTIRMAFDQVAERVRFTFSDDGRGIDWEKLGKKAREKGLPADTHEDLVEAIFTDSISTRDTATLTSGRGVGMAAVREAVLARGGRVFVDSARGVGTTWTFVFPATASDRPSLASSSESQGGPSNAASLRALPRRTSALRPTSLS